MSPKRRNFLLRPESVQWAVVRATYVLLLRCSHLRVQTPSTSSRYALFCWNSWERLAKSARTSRKGEKNKQTNKKTKTNLESAHLIRPTINLMLVHSIHWETDKEILVYSLKKSDCERLSSFVCFFFLFNLNLFALVDRGPPFFSRKANIPCEKERK